MSLIAKPFVFIRHGETPLNRANVIGGSTDVPLTEAGELQAQAAASVLAQREWSCLVVSPMLRTRQTAALALPGRDMVLVEGIRERDWGALEGRPLSEQPAYESTPPEGEAWDDFCLRVTSALNRVLQDYDTPVVVAHSGVFRVLRLLATGTPYGPRIGNGVPMWIQPGTTPDAWRIEPLTDWLRVTQGE
ncbi:hypothetical protein CIG19_17810 [Enterobacterales bacterium CwR94]|nr:hypothetical protein CIG19_17810 [Enterobacterales bacterium CwR94]